MVYTPPPYPAELSLILLFVINTLVHGQGAAKRKLPSGGAIVESTLGKDQLATGHGVHRTTTGGHRVTKKNTRRVGAASSALLRHCSSHQGMVQHKTRGVYLHHGATTQDHQPPALISRVVVEDALVASEVRVFLHQPPSPHDHRIGVTVLAVVVCHMKSSCKHRILPADPEPTPCQEHNKSKQAQVQHRGDCIIL